MAGATRRPRALLLALVAATVAVVAPVLFASVAKELPPPPGRTKKGEKRMNIVLLKDYEYLGKAGETFRVKKGYFRNYLWPHGIAEKEDQTVMKRLEKAALLAKDAKQAAVAGALKSKKAIEKVKTFSFEKKLREKGGQLIYGSVSQANVAEAIMLATGIVVKTTAVEIPKIVELGTFPGKVAITPDVAAFFEMNVVAEGASIEAEEEAEE
eukprot:TRINITY_DN123921_c0_g1_i1.p1 TRINITY_DN123921_c0_g1~~TRINITY_DN123921_c0_g1_i1.p1  ORF type:complete len:211 (-),score=91.32 TRINITY_DN123921_c0_g1_i1:121-753(-)